MGSIVDVCVYVGDYVVVCTLLCVLMCVCVCMTIEWNLFVSC